MYGKKMSLTHQQLDRRSLAFDRIIVYLIEHDPNKRGLAVAKENLAKWMAKEPDSIPFKMWDKMLEEPWEEIRKYMLTQSDKMQFLRQASPFAGEECIPNEIRMRIIHKYYAKVEKEIHS